eukprot:2044611-Alexandrium_andersonii.AAC.1
MAPKKDELRTFGLVSKEAVAGFFAPGRKRPAVGDPGDAAPEAPDSGVVPYDALPPGATATVASLQEAAL